MPIILMWKAKSIYYEILRFWSFFRIIYDKNTSCIRVKMVMKGIKEYSKRFYYWKFFLSFFFLLPSQFLCLYMKFNLIFEVPKFPKVFNTNSYRIASANSIDQGVVRNLIKYSFKKCGKSTVCSYHFQDIAAFSRYFNPCSF